MMGSTVDQQRRSHIREDDEHVRNDINRARRWIYERGYAPEGSQIEALLASRSLIPVQVCLIFYHKFPI